MNTQSKKKHYVYWILEKFAILIVIKISRYKTYFTIIDEKNNI